MADDDHLDEQARLHGELAAAGAELRHRRQREHGLVGLGHNSTEWRDRDGRRWTVHFEWGDVGGRAECIGLRVENPMTARDWRPVTAKLLQRLPVGALIDQARRARAAEAADNAKHFPHLAERMQRQAERYGARRGRALDPETLAAVAEVYTAAWNDSRPPVQAVADAFFISRSAAAKRVQAARRAGHLPATTERQAKGSAR